MKPLILCADDYAQNPGISLGIRKLVADRRLSAVSCFTVTPGWETEGPLLAACGDHFDIGLHFSLTHPGKSTLTDWILRSLRGKIDHREIREHLLFQWQQFRMVLQRDPAYLDGHQHVHALPGIATVIDETLRELGVSSDFPIRRVNRPVFSRGDLVKTSILRFLAGRGQKDCLFAGNEHFGGLYDFGPGFEKWMPRWLQLAPPGTLIMCHPGLPDPDTEDPIAPARQREFEFLSSDAFLSALESENIRLRGFA